MFDATHHVNVAFKRWVDASKTGDQALQYAAFQDYLGMWYSTLAPAALKQKAQEDPLTKAFLRIVREEMQILDRLKRKPTPSEWMMVCDAIAHRISVECASQVGDHFKRTYLHGMQQAASNVGVTSPPFGPIHQEALKTALRGEGLALSFSGFSDDLSLRLRDVVVNAFKEGRIGHSQIVTRLIDEAGWRARSRLQTIAITETSKVQNTATYNTYRQLEREFDEQDEWVYEFGYADDNKTCVRCDRAMQATKGGVPLDKLKEIIVSISTTPKTMVDITGQPGVGSSSWEPTRDGGFPLMHPVCRHRFVRVQPDVTDAEEDIPLPPRQARAIKIVQKEWVQDGQSRNGTPRWRRGGEVRYQKTKPGDRQASEEEYSPTSPQPKDPTPENPPPKDTKELVSSILAQNPGLKLDFYEGKEFLTLSRIEVPKDNREQGLGTKVMRTLIDHADRLGKPMALTPDSAYGGSVSRLKEFYSRFGFVSNSGRNKDFTTRETMIRPATPGKRVKPLPPDASKLPPPTSIDQLDAYIAEVEKDPRIKEAEDRSRFAINHDTLSRYKTEYGWLPERMELHAEIMGKILNPAAQAPPGTKPKAVLMIGPPGAGKSTVLAPRARELAPAWTEANPDNVKAHLPEYEGGRNASGVHEESSEVNKEIRRRAIEANHNLLVDESGWNEKRMNDLVDDLKAHGYEVHLMMSDVQEHVAAHRAVQRFLDPKNEGRYTPLRYIKDWIDGKPRTTYASLKGKVHSYTLFDNSGAQATLVESGRNDKIDKSAKPFRKGKMDKPQKPGPNATATDVAVYEDEYDDWVYYSDEEYR